MEDDMTNLVTYIPADSKLTKHPESAVRIICAGQNHDPRHATVIVIGDEETHSTCACEFQVVGKPNAVFSVAMTHRLTGSTVFTTTDV